MQKYIPKTLTGNKAAGKKNWLKTVPIEQTIFRGFSKLKLFTAPSYRKMAHTQNLSSMIGASILAPYGKHQFTGHVSWLFALNFYWHFLTSALIHLLASMKVLSGYRRGRGCWSRVGGLKKMFILSEHCYEKIGHHTQRHGYLSYWKLRIFHFIGYQKVLIRVILAKKHKQRVILIIYNHLHLVWKCLNCERSHR